MKIKNDPVAIARGTDTVAVEFPEVLEMRRVSLLFCITLILFVEVSAQSGRRIVNPPTPREPVIETPSSPVAERPAPAELTALPESLLDRELKALDKGSFRLSDFSGKVVVLNLFASWCGPCRNEVPDYERVRKEYVGRPVEFIGLTTEDPRTAADRVNRFVRELNFKFRLGWADPLTARTLMNGKGVIPQTLVIGSDGHIISHWRGYSPGRSRDRLRETIEQALSATSAGAKSQ